MKRGLLLVSAFLLHVCVSAEPAMQKSLLEAFSSPQLWSQSGNCEAKVMGDANGNFLRIQNTGALGNERFSGGYLHLPVDKIAGRRISLSVEARCEDGAPAINLCLTPKDRKAEWLSLPKREVAGEWTVYASEVDIPLELAKATLILGVSKEKERADFQRLQMDAGDVTVDLRRSFNMEFADSVAGDGKGGWSDQGPDNDARNFPVSQKSFAGIPFRITTPAQNEGRSILAFRSPHMPNGAKDATVDLSGIKAAGKNLYLLHTLCWGVAGETVGWIDLENAGGYKNSYPVICGKDVADWWNPTRQTNAFPGVFWRNGSGAAAGAYISRFPIDPQMGNVARVSFRSEPGCSSLWIAIAATISQNDYPAPETENFAMKPGDGWKEIHPVGIFRIEPGSVMDLSFLNPVRDVDASGRVVVRSDGHLAFEKNPGKQVRFLAEAIGTTQFWGFGKNRPPDFISHEMIKEFVAKIRASGHNMVRMHFLDSVLMHRSEEGRGDCVFYEDFLDKWDYLVSCLKENGIYLNLDVMSSRIGYAAGNPWIYKTKNGTQDSRDFKYDMHWSKEARENWRNGMEKLLTHINPYTGKALANDPVLAIVVCFNEQEFGFEANKRPFVELLPRWKEFLRKKYGGEENLKKSWGADAPESFESIQPVQIANIGARTQKGEDSARFLTECESDTYRFYASELRRVGYQGIISNYNCLKSLRYDILRLEGDAVTMNSYFAHPSAYGRPGSAINQGSSIGDALNVMRGMATSRLYGKPIFITEHSHVFWNRYRYEQAFVSGAYASFQDFDCMTNFAGHVTMQPVDLLEPFSSPDPIRMASEYLTALLFLRQDVAPSKTMVRVHFEPEEIFSRKLWSNSMDGQQSKLALVAGISLEASPSPPVGKNEAIFQISGGSEVIVHHAYSNIRDAGPERCNLNQALDYLKKNGLLREGNSSNVGKERYESSSGELLVDADKNRMEVRTPRFQGLCSEAGGAAEFEDLSVQKMSVRGNLALAALDGMNPLRTATRMALAISTNVLNSNMRFDNKEMRTILGMGTPPPLMQTGRFAIVVRNVHSKDMKLYQLDMSGRRLAELPLEKRGDSVFAEIDTASLPGGPSIFFEFSAQRNLENGK